LKCPIGEPTVLDMTPEEQALWKKAGRLAFKETDDFNEGKFDDLFYRVALDYYTKLLKEHLLEQVLKITYPYTDDRTEHHRALRDVSNNIREHFNILIGIKGK